MYLIGCNILLFSMFDMANIDYSSEGSLPEEEFDLRFKLLDAQYRQHTAAKTLENKHHLDLIKQWVGQAQIQGSDDEDTLIRLQAYIEERPPEKLSPCQHRVELSEEAVHPGF